VKPGFAFALLAAFASPAFAGGLPYDGSPDSARGFVVLENKLSYRLVEKPEPSEEGARWMLDWELGYMRNLDGSNAVGATLKIHSDTDGDRVGPMLRYRRWLDRSVGLDVGLGLYLAGDEGPYDYRFPMPAVEVGLTYDDWVALQGGVDFVKRTSDSSQGALEQSHVEPYVGLRVGRVLALATTVGYFAFRGFVGW
jgi:hypothetical protein